MLNTILDHVYCIYYIIIIIIIITFQHGSAGKSKAL